MTRIQHFGGSHTEQKLEAVASYLKAYVAVMKKQRFKLTYFDAFAGSGASQSAANQSRPDSALLEDEVFDAQTIIAGSPVRALGVEPPFDRYRFVDANPANVRSLQDLVAEYPARQTEVLEGDATYT